MALYIGDKKVKLNLGGSTYKIADPVLAYVRLIQGGKMPIENLPRQYRSAVMDYCSTHNIVLPGM